MRDQVPLFDGRENYVASHESVWILNRHCQNYLSITITIKKCSINILETIAGMMRSQLSSRRPIYLS